MPLLPQRKLQLVVLYGSLIFCSLPLLAQEADPARKPDDTSAAAPRPIPPDLNQPYTTLVGQRPYRRGGIRLGQEAIGNHLVFHGYGHGGAGITLSWGTAVLLVDKFLQQNLSQATPIAILGMGVIGLSVAAVLQDHGYRNITFYTSEQPLETTSNVAGGLIAPVSVDPGSSPEAKAQFAQLQGISITHFRELVEDPSWGVRWHTLWEHASPEDIRSGLWLAIEERLLPNPIYYDELPLPGPRRSGYAYLVLVASTAQYLTRLLEQVKAGGAKITMQRFAQLDEVMALEQTVIFNALGMGAAALFADTAMYPVHGTILLFPETRPVGEDDLWFFDDYQYGVTNVQPDGSRVLKVGGTFIPYKTASVADPADVERILAANQAAFSTPSPTLVADRNAARRYGQMLGRVLNTLQQLSHGVSLQQQRDQSTALQMYLAQFYLHLAQMLYGTDLRLHLVEVAHAAGLSSAQLATLLDIYCVICPAADLPAELLQQRQPSSSADITTVATAGLQNLVMAHLTQLHPTPAIERALLTFIYEPLTLEMISSELHRGVLELRLLQRPSLR